MMTKKNILLFAVSGAAIAALAFTKPSAIREQFLTVFYPQEAPAFDEIPEPVVAAPEVPFNWKYTPVAPAVDTLDPLEERFDDFLNSPTNLIDLKDPAVVEQSVEYDPATGQYIIYEKIGDDYFRTPTYMTFDEYMKWRDEKQQRDYFDRLNGVVDGQKTRGSLVDPISKFNIRTSLIERLFGGTEVDIKPQGSINLTFGFNHQKLENPILPIRLQRNTNFDFDMDINMSAQGKIGEKLNLNFNYNTQATFDFDNQMKLHYDPKASGTPDEILQNIEAGNVSMPLRSTLIKGAQNLFGIKAELKFGHLNTTLIASQQRSKQNGLTLQGGAQVQKFRVPIDEYDENRHFFLSQWNRNNFEPALRCLPTPLSQFNITKLEVWVTRPNNLTQGGSANQINFRDIVAIADLAEAEPLLDGTNPSDPMDMLFPDFRNTAPYRDVKGVPLPENRNNDIYKQVIDGGDGFRESTTAVPSLNALGLKPVRDYQVFSGIQLIEGNDFTYNSELGFISINRNVNSDDVIGIAVEYTYNGQPYKIGEFGSEVVPADSTEANDPVNYVLYTKMLKSTTANVNYPIWDLMMKNVYSVGAVNVDPQQFRFDIFYEDPGKGQKRFLDNPDLIPEQLRSKPLLQIFRLDTLNLQNDPGPDGIFDFVPGLTVNVRSGRIMFPVLEPFGEHLKKALLAAGANEADITKKLLYTQLYDSTLFRAREFQQFNRFVLSGEYKSSTSSEISLGTFNLPPGSVRVTGGGRQLIEGQDYTIDYNIGKVRILNESILQSGQAINVSFEDNTLFGFNARTMLGARFDYEFNKNLTVGGTFMNLFERPLTQKVNFGDDPINNKVYGLDFNYTKDAPWLTRAIDRLPMLSTKAESSITASAEVAALQPGYSKAINQGSETGGTAYIDDFEGSTANIPLSFPANSWMIASVPQGEGGDNETLFPENIAGNSVGDDSLALGANRARLSWYIADPSALDGDDRNNPYSRLFRFQDIFPNKQLSPLEQSTLRPLDITIFPKQRGPYNFDLPNGYPGISQGFNDQGELRAPETRWAGFMRGINNSSNDFEATNVEFIEFWMLNPYIDKPEGVSNSGEMIIDLGSISEDVMRDSRQFFESGLPINADNPNSGVVRTPWGRVPALAPLVTAFANEPGQRALQDVGLDGLDDDGERSYYNAWLEKINNSTIQSQYKAIMNTDPSGDDFVHYRDGRFAQGGTNPQPGVQERYRNFNSAQGNTPVGTGNDFVTSSTNYPDMEDLNNDRALNQTESYFRYRIPLVKTTVGNVGGELDFSEQSANPDAKLLATLITDTVVVGDATWYRFKVPLDWNQRKAINGIQDLRAIQFVRMVWRGFDEQTTFRFATLEMGRNQWRRYKQLVTGFCGGDDGNPSQAVSFDINSVSIEENAARTPFNYTIPPGIQRENSVGAFPDILQNEQALSLSVCDLPYCEGRSIFKPLNMDLRQFERIKMFAHAEPQDPTAILDSTALKIFIRLGSDFVNNYYEYEIPLLPSDPTKVMGFFNTDDEYKKEVWKNIFDFRLEDLTALKLARNSANAPADVLFIIPDPNNPQNRIKVVGNPNLGYVKGVMVGTMNVKENTTQCFETWINELRLNGFNNRGGYAGTARVDVKLADLGNVSAAGTFTSRGWGGIDQKLLQRQLEDVTQLDVSTNLALDKFLPTKWGIRLPFYAQYSNLTRRPEYDPYDLDVKLSDKLRLADPADRDSIRNAAFDVTTVRGYNFTNVRKERKGKARKVPLPWNIENFSVTYAYNEQNRRTPYILSDRIKQYKGGLDYQYATGLQPIQPFKKAKMSDKYFKWIKDFNFNPLPETYGFSTNLQRIAGVTVWRPFTAGESIEANTYYNRRFTWDRNYDLSWTIAKSLRFNFDANARSIIDEPQEFNPDGSRVSTLQRRDSILSNLRNLGRPKNYTHTAGFNYTVPFKSIPILDWVSVKANYTTGYTWSAQSLKLANLDAGQYQAFENSRDLGNVIQNNVVRQVNGDLNFENLYKKSKYLAKINKPASKSTGSKNSKNDPGGIDDGRGGRGGRGGAPGGDLGPGGMQGGGDKGSAGKPSPRDPNNITPPVPGGGGPGGAGPGGAPGPKVDKDGKPIGEDKDGIADKKGSKSKDKKKKDREPSMAERIALRPLMLVRKVRFNYTENQGSIVPGFTPETKLLGLSEGFAAPGWGYITGATPTEQWLNNAAQSGWITNRFELNQQVTRNYTQSIDAGATIEPFRDFKIEVSATRQYTKNSTELFKDQDKDLDPNATNFEHRAYRDVGSYTVSFFAMNTMFNKDLDGLFNRFEANGPIISSRLAVLAGETGAHDNPDKNPGYSDGYGKINQEVLIPAFLAAYTNKDASTSNLDIFSTKPAPNWKLTYNGLAKVGNLSKIFSSVQISHGYKSTLTVNSFNTDIFYNQTNPFQKDDINFNYIARLEIPQVMIDEQFQPLLGVDMKFKSGMTFGVDFKKSRRLAMSFVDFNLSETNRTGYSISFGHRIKDVDIPFLTGSNKGKGSKSKKSSKKKKGPATPPVPGGGGSAQNHDLSFKFNFEYTDDITLVHSLQRDEAQPSRGSTSISVNPSIDYQLNRRLALRLFTDYRRTIPKTSQSFPLTSINGGITIQFKLN